MNDQNMNPNYRGRALKSILADYYLPEITLELGTTLIQKISDAQVYFQLGEDFIEHLSDPPKFVRVLPGSCIRQGMYTGKDVEYVISTDLYIPSEDELSFYENQHTV